MRPPDAIRADLALVEDALASQPAARELAALMNTKRRLTVELWGENRPEKPAWTPKQLKKWLKHWKNTQNDPTPTNTPNSLEWLKEAPPDWITPDTPLFEYMCRISAKRAKHAGQRLKQC